MHLHATIYIQGLSSYVVGRRRRQERDSRIYILWRLQSPEWDPLEPHLSVLSDRLTEFGRHLKVYLVPYRSLNDTGADGVHRDTIRSNASR